MSRRPRIVVVGGGFAGVWSALGAACRLEEAHATGSVDITLVSADPYLTIRPRLYERDLDGLRVPLDSVLGPPGIARVEGQVLDIDPVAQAITATVGGTTVRVEFDRLVLAAGSRVQRPPIPGLAEHAFSVDTYAEARRLECHLQAEHGRYDAAVIGAGFTGIELASELAGRLRALAEERGQRSPVCVTLIDRAPHVGGDIGPAARPFVEEALRLLGISVRVGVGAKEITANAVVLDDGHAVSSATTVWAGGLRASPLTRLFGIPADGLGRLPVDATLRVAGAESVFAAGDVAHALATDGHPTYMSCQHAIPMGKFAGYNAASDLVGGAPLGYRQPDYVTCLDLGPAGALFTRGWDRAVLFEGAVGKRLKQQINQYDIYPPLSGNRDELLRAARPEVVNLQGLVDLGRRLVQEQRTAAA